LGWKSSVGLRYMRNGDRENSMSLLRKEKNMSQVDVMRKMAFTPHSPEGQVPLG